METMAHYTDYDTHGAGYGGYDDYVSLSNVIGGYGGKGFFLMSVPETAIINNET